MSNANEPPSDKLFVATRIDGLGGRLLAIVNAIFLANETGFRFGFTWNRSTFADKDFHSVDIASAVFDGPFLEKHYLGEKLDCIGFARLGDTPFSVSDLKAQSEDGVRGWLCDSFEIVNQMVAETSVKARATAVAFRSIGFAEPIREAIRAAEAVAISPHSAAVHLRSGDIVHGRYRRRPFFTQKVIPSPLAKGMIRHLQERGTEVILFGEHVDTLNYVKSATGCRLVGELGAPSPDASMARALFEMVVMSRCTEIYAGTSMFAAMASTIGSSPICSPEDLLGRERLSRELLTELEENASAYHPREAAYAYLFAYARLTDEAGADGQEELLDRAHRLDPENDFYPLKKAVWRFEKGHYAEGETILSRLYRADDKESARTAASAIRFLKVRNWQGVFDWEEDIPLFKAAAFAGMPHAAACCAIFLGASGDARAAIEMIERALAVEPRNPLFRLIAHKMRKAAPSSVQDERRGRAKELLRQAIARCSRLLGVVTR
jgi:tetratricopeptide (TPR) repeat protein